MRTKNSSRWLLWRLAVPVLWRDLQAVGYALLRDRSMLSAIFYQFRPEVRTRLRRHREIIQSRRKVSDRELLWWFSETPRAIDIALPALRFEPEYAMRGLTSGERH
jgi:hypothetical protein